MTSDTSPPLVSIIVPCRNEAAYIQTFLLSVFTQEMDGLPFEVIIADGFSADGTRELLHELISTYKNVYLIDNPGRIVSTGLNAALKVARGEIIIRMDVHTEYAPDYIRMCLEVMHQTGADNVGGCQRTKGTDRVSRALAAVHHSRFAVGGSRSHQPDYEGGVESVYLGCWHKEYLLRLGGFDESLVRNQDDELNLRLRRAGGQIWQSRRIVCWYTPRQSLKQLRRQYFQYGFWKVAVIRKHRIPASWRHLMPGAFVFSNLVLLLTVLLTLVVPLPAWLRIVEKVLFAGTALYAVLVVINALSSASISGWENLPLLLILYPTYHLAYGVGFLVGTLHFGWAGASARRAAPIIYTELSR